MPPKSAKLQHYSLSRQNSIRFYTDFTWARKKFTQTLFARLYVFASLVYRSANVRSAGEHKFKCLGVEQVYRTAGVQEVLPLQRFSIYNCGALQDVWGGAGIGLHIVWGCEGELAAIQKVESWANCSLHGLLKINSGNRQTFWVSITGHLILK